MVADICWFAPDMLIVTLPRWIWTTPERLGVYPLPPRTVIASAAKQSRAVRKRTGLPRHFVPRGEKYCFGNTVLGAKG